MRKIHSLLLIVLIVLSGCATQGVSPPDSSSLLAESTRFSGYMNSRNYIQVAVMTHPTIIEGVGGISVMAQAVERMLSPRTLGGILTSFEFKSPDLIVSINDALVAIVPYESALYRNGKLYILESFYIAWSPDKGESWFFADGVGAYRPGALEYLFPGYAGELTIPEKKQPYEST
ncbi:MAG: hypothetical protein V7731_20340 [Amphritea sp.]